MGQKRLRLQSSLLVLEAGYVWCSRRDIDFNEKTFTQEYYLSGDFDCEKGSEFSRIVDDLSAYRHIKGYELSEISVDEYESCVDYFSY